MSEGEIWFWCMTTGFILTLPIMVVWYYLTKPTRHTSPPCHVVGCKRRVTHSHWPQDDPYDVQYLCPRHTGEMMDPDRSYVVEPWRTELSDRAIHELIRSEWHWKQREKVS